MDYGHVFEDAYNLLCGALIGEGSFRKVFECRLRPELVVKVELDPDNNYRTFTNVMEMHLWDHNREYKKVSDWLAPCDFLSPDGRILLQRRIDVFREDDPRAPKELPQFLTDRKFKNFGLYEGRVVCCDYAMTVTNPPTKLTPSSFW